MTGRRKDCRKRGRNEGEKICSDEVKRKGLLQPIPGLERQLQSGRIFAPSPKKSNALKMLQNSYESDDEELNFSNASKRSKKSLSSSPSSHSKTLSTDDKTSTSNSANSSFALEINVNFDEYFSDAEDILDSTPQSVTTTKAKAIPVAYKEDIKDDLSDNIKEPAPSTCRRLRQPVQPPVASSPNQIKPKSTKPSRNASPNIQSSPVSFSPKEISTPLSTSTCSSEDYPTTPPKPQVSKESKLNKEASSTPPNTPGFRTPPAPKTPGCTFHESSTVNDTHWSGLAYGFSPHASIAANSSFSSAKNFDDSFDSSDDAQVPLVDRIKPLPSPDHTLVDEMARRAEEDEEEPMDWDHVEVEQELKKCREAVSKQEPSHFTDLNNLGFEAAPCSSKSIYVVVDTNVWISDIGAVEDILKATTRSQWIVYVPWTVLCELDSLKSSQKLEVALNAKKANHILSEYMRKTKSRLVGQSGQQEKEASTYFHADTADDKILQACIQLRNSGKEVQLMTQDKNLIAKSCTFDISKFDSKNNNNSGISVTEYFNRFNNRPSPMDTDMKTTSKKGAPDYVRSRLKKDDRLPPIDIHQLRQNILNATPTLVLTDKHSHLLKLLLDVWQFSSKFVVSYCKLLGIQPVGISAQDTIQVRQEDLEVVNDYLESIANALGNALLIPSDELHVSSRAVIKFHSMVTCFFVKVRVSKGYLVNDHPPIQHVIMLDLFKDATQRCELERGLTELQALLKNLAVCKRVRKNQL